MKIVVQRAKEASVTVNSEIVGQIEFGLMVLVGITHDDTLEDVMYCAKKIANMRIFEDDEAKLNLSIKDVGGQILSVSQFTLYAETKKGNRPSFIKAAKPDVAQPLYEAFNACLEDEYGIRVETGVFGAMMDVKFTNDGPVTIIVES